MPDALEEECLFAAIGLDAILEARPTMHRYQLEQAAKTPKDITRRIRAFMAKDAFAPAADMLPFDYAETLKTVMAGQTTEQTQALFAAVPDKELAHDIGLRADAITTWAQGQIPKPTVDAPFGTNPMPPDDVEQADFRRVWQVVRSPLTVLDDLEDGSLGDDQVATLVQFFPGMYSEMRQAVNDARAALSARRGPKWEPPSTKVALLGTLMQQDATNIELAAAVQTSYSQAQQQQPAGGAAPKAKAPNAPAGAAEGDLTPGQKAAAG